MSTDVMTRPDEDDYTLSEVAELLAGEKERFTVRPSLAPAVDRVFSQMYWATGFSRDRMSAESLARALVIDHADEDDLPCLAENRLSRGRPVDFYWPIALSWALESEVVSRSWALPVLIEYLTARYVVGWAADLTRRDIEPLRVTG